MFKRAALFTALSLVAASAATAAQAYRFYTPGTGQYVAAPDSAEFIVANPCTTAGGGVDCYGTPNLALNMASAGVTAVASAGGTATQAFQDLLTRGGLGAFTTSPNDDSITGGESLTLTFSRVIQLTGFYAWADHVFATGETFIINGQNFSAGAAGSWIDTSSLAASNTFTFSTLQGQNFYVSAINIVPEPASLALLGLGLMGVGVVRRKRAA